MTVVEKPQQSTFLVGSLQAETDYVLTVVAYNGKDEPSEPATHSFTTPAYTAFARIDAVATAHGIYLKADVDTGKFPLYFLKIFDPDLTGIPAPISKSISRSIPGSSSSITSKSPH